MMFERIGRYQVKSELGRGGMASVYLAYDPHFDRDVAVKILPDQLLNESRSRERFRREAKTIAQLEHPSIVPVYDFGEDNGRPFLVMRYMAGGSLMDWLKQGPLQVETAVSIIKRIAAGLDAAHQQGLVHRDLKPSNILLDNRGDPHLSDFGIAKLTESISSITGSSLIGTPAYMSPEQVYGDIIIDHRSDVYALGVVLFEMLTGKKPYKADTPAKQMMAHALEPVPDIHRFNADLSPDMAEIVNKAMAKEREARFNSAGEMAAELDKADALVRQSLPLLAEQTTPTATSAIKAAKRNRRWIWLPLGLALFLALLITVRSFIAQNEFASTLEATQAVTETAVANTEEAQIASFPTRSITPIDEQNLLAATITATFTPAMATPIFSIVSLQNTSPLETPETNLGLQPGEHTLLGIPFESGWKVSTQCEQHEDHHQTAVGIKADIPNPNVIYILLQGGQALQQYDGQAFGKIILEFVDGQRLVEPVVLGHNIRDWRRNLPDLYINNAESYYLQEAWRGTTEDGLDGRIDLLTIIVPEKLRGNTLHNIQLIDTSVSLVGSKAPCIHLIAITVEGNS